MSRLPPTLLALALAFALCAPLHAQQITTSKGVRTLTRTEGFKTEIQFRQAERIASDIAYELVADINASETSRGEANTQVTDITDRAKKANDTYTAAKAAFDAKDQAYRASLQAFELRQATFANDLNNQRAQAAVLEALPSAQRDHAEVVRLNDWAQQLSNTRTQLEGQRSSLLAEHDQVEEERAKLAKQRGDAENSLKGQRDSTVAQLGQAKSSLKASYTNLRVVVNYINQVREQQRALTHNEPARSEILEQATTKLRLYEAGNPGQ